MRAVDLFIISYREAAKTSAAVAQNMQDIEREMAMSIATTQSGDIAVTTADARTLMNLCQKYGDKFTIQAVLPLVKRSNSNSDFIVAFLTAFLTDISITPMLRLENVQHLFMSILGDVIPNLQLDCREAGSEQSGNDFAKRRRFNHGAYGIRAGGDRNPRLMTAENLAALFDSCEKLGQSQEIDQLANKTISHVSNANPTTFEHVLLPLLEQLPPSVERDPGSPSFISYKRLFRTVLSFYISTYVQKHLKSLIASSANLEAVAFTAKIVSTSISFSKARTNTKGFSPSTASAVIIYKSV